MPNNFCQGISDCRKHDIKYMTDMGALNSLPQHEILSMRAEIISIKRYYVHIHTIFHSKCVQNQLTASTELQ